MMHAEWLPIVMQGSFDEVYVMDCDSLRFITVNQAACTHLQYAETELLGKTPFEISRDLVPATFTAAAQRLRTGESAQENINLTQIRADGSSYSVALRLLHCASSQPPTLIAISHHLDPTNEAGYAWSLSESRFHAIALNTPGMVYQFQKDTDGNSSFTYVSEGCHALLGISPERICADSSIFINLILSDDRPSYHESMKTSVTAMKSWNWEGRIWIEQWNDVKWINLRAMPEARADGSVQWVGIMTNITQSKLEEVELKQSRAQLAELSAHIQTLKEQERTSIAREIHDDLGGNLTAIKMALALLVRRLPDGDDALIEKAAYVDSLVDRTIESVHRIAGDLRPSILDLGIVAAIDWQAKEFEKQLGIPCEFSSNRSEIELNADQATALFRIFQEAVTNVGKHAKASKVAVRLMNAQRSLKLEIIDNGCGIEATDRLKPKSFGIRGMKERVSALGGELAVHRAVTGGTVVAIRIPLART